MNKKLKNKKIKIIFGLILLITLNFASILSFHAPMKKNNSELYELRNSGLSYDIEINDLPGSLTNWSWAATQPWFGGGSGTSGDPYIIEDETFMYSSGMGECLRIFHSRKHFIIRNCTIINSHPVWAGLHLYNVTNGQILDNDIIFNGYGIVYIDVSNTFITNNNISVYSEYGIWLIGDCDNNIIIGNTVNGNGGWYGIALESNADNNTIYDYVITENINTGIYIGGSSTGNLLYRNIFLSNERHAYDDGSNNDWNSTTIGNYWDNHTGPDTSPNDGIVDNPYTYIGGSAGSIDYLPIAEEGPPSIIINSPSEDDVFGTSAPSFSVTITDKSLDETWYTLDGGLHNYTFTGSTVTIDQSAWTALSEGSVTITFYANDTLGNLASESVNVVKSLPPPDNFVVIIIIVISIVSGVAILTVVLLLRRRKAGGEV
ncbi:MAG: hypothetical protein CEE42_12690 [Promethearchaeota archaeon Loki_b31]|nr:MAG: hypothetical protein CEE42_12690 [Candidatus Lokiarchaeota archaeon Loki_b31]